MSKFAKCVGLLLLFGIPGTALADIVIDADDVTVTSATDPLTDPLTCTHSGGRTCWASMDHSNIDGAFVENLVGAASGSLSKLYKAEVGGFDEGTFAGQYQTTFSNSSSDPMDALIEWIGAAAIDCSSPCYLVVKDGNKTPGTYVFDISDWDGEMNIDMQDFWANCDLETEVCDGAISHVSIWGAEQQVPEPGTLALLGLGLFGLGLSRRRLSSAGN